MRGKRTRYAKLLLISCRDMVAHYTIRSSPEWFKTDIRSLTQTKGRCYAFCGDVRTFFNSLVLAGINEEDLHDINRA